MVDVGIQVGPNKICSDLTKMAKNIVGCSKNRDKLSRQYDPIHFITENYVERIWLFQKHKCFHCDKIMQLYNRNKPDGCTIERLDNKFGHTIKNCVLACKSCNVKISGGRPKGTKNRAKGTKMFRMRT